MPKCTYREAHSAAKKKIGKGRRTGEWQYECWIDGRFQFKVTIPDSGGKGAAQIRPGTLNSIMKQLKLKPDEFNAWRDCPMDADRYEQLMRERLGL